MKIKLDTNQRYHLLELLYKYHEGFDKEPHNISPIVDYVELAINTNIKQSLENLPKKVSDSIISNIKNELVKAINQHQS